MLIMVRITPMATAKKSKTSAKLRVKACSGVFGSAIASVENYKIILSKIFSIYLKTKKFLY